MEPRIASLKFRAQKNCFIVIPRHWKPHYGQTAFHVWQINQENDRHAAFVSSSSENIENDNGVIYINGNYAHKLKLKEYDSVIISPYINAGKAVKVIIKPLTTHDWSVIEKHSDRVENTMLNQIRVVWKGQVAPLWISQGVCIYFRVIGIYPPQECLILDNTTELHVEPNLTDAESNSELDELFEVESISYGSEFFKKIYDFSQSIFGWSKLREDYNSNSSTLTKNDIITFNSILRINQFNENCLFKTINQSFDITLHPSIGFAFLIDFPHLNQSVIRCMITKVQSPLQKNHTTENEVCNKSIEIILLLLDFDGKFKSGDVEFKIENFDKQSIILNDFIFKKLELDIYDRVKISNSVFPLKSCPKLLLNPGIKLPEKFTESMLESAFRHFLKCSTSINMPIIYNKTLNYEINMSIPISPNSIVPVVTKLENPSEYKENCFYLYHGCNVIVQSSLNIISNETKTKKVLPLYKTFENLVEISKDDIQSSLIALSGLNGNTLLVTGFRGSGKSCFLRAISLHLEKYKRFYVEWVDCKPLKGKRFDATEKIIKSAISNSVYKNPSLLILDDFDSICPSISELEATGNDAQNTVKIAESIRSLIKMSRERNLKISFLISANSKTTINSLLNVGRGFHVFLNTIELKPLNFEKRIAFLKYFFKDLYEADFYFEEIAKSMDGFIAQDYENLLSLYHHKHAIALDLSFSEILKEAINEYVPISFRNVSFTKLQEKVEWEDVGGLSYVKENLLKMLYWPAKYPKLMKAINRPSNAGVLLYGAPGTGKTHLVAAVAAKTGLRLIVVKGPELLNKYIGASEASVRNIFQRATAAKPSLLFFDELEALAPKRGHDSTGVTDRVVNQLLTELDGVEGRDGVFVIGATSRPDLVDSALLRPGRFDKKLHCNLPDVKERLEIFEIIKRKCQLNLSDDVDLKFISEKCVCFSAADIKALFCSAQLYAYQRNNLSLTSINGNVQQSSVNWVLESIDSMELKEIRENSDELRIKDSMEIVILNEDFDRVLAEQKPSVDESERLRYEAIHASMTNRSFTSLNEARATLA